MTALKCGRNIKSKSKGMVTHQQPYKNLECFAVLGPKSELTWPYNRLSYAANDGVFDFSRNKTYENSDLRVLYMGIRSAAC